MGPRRVPRRDDPVQIQPVFLRQAPKVIRPGSHVQERAGPTPTVVPHPPVLQAPYREPLSCESLLQLPHVADVEHGEPAPAVDEHHHRVGPIPFRQPQVTELERLFAVRNHVLRSWGLHGHHVTGREEILGMESAGPRDQGRREEDNGRGG